MAIIGQSLFGQEVYSSLRKQGHKVVGVFTVPDKDGKADPLGELFPLFSPSLNGLNRAQKTKNSRCLWSFFKQFKEFLLFINTFTVYLKYNKTY